MPASRLSILPAPLSVTSNAHRTADRQPLAAALCILMLCAFLFTPCIVFAADKPAIDSPGKPSGRITMEIGQGGFILSATGGKGTLTFKGRKYPFKIGGMGIGGLGVSKIAAAGDVFNLKRIEDFPGAFIQARAGYAAVEGKGTQWLENTNGVVLKLRFTSKGMSLNLGADGIKIEMGSIKSK